MYRSTRTVSILSEQPIPEGTDIADIAREGDEGSYVIDVTEGPTEKLDGKQMADALTAAGSDPSFFNLDDDGNSTLEPAPEVPAA